MKIALAIAYVGTRYHGWQYQSNVSSVQEALEAALSKLACHDVKVFCAGRTDKGVHATHQIVHFETQTVREMHTWVSGTNAHLPSDINVVWATQVSNDFHARFSAISRAYNYLIYNDKIKPTHFAEGITWYPYQLDESKMHQAAQVLIGTHDFSSFRDKQCQAKHPVRTLEFVNIERKGKVIVVHIKANAFLHHMVRNIVGTLLPIGQSKQPIEWMEKVLSVKDRSQAGLTAPAQGLYLTEVNYLEEFTLPSTQDLPWMLIQ